MVSELLKQLVNVPAWFSSWRLASWPFLLAIILVLALHRWWKRRNQPAPVSFPLPIPGNLAIKNPIKWQLFLRYAGFVLILLALARPQTSYRQTERVVSGVDIMMLMDVSASMNVEDMADRSRLEVAKDVMETFIKGRENDRIGFIIFSGEPLTVAPPTLDYGLVLNGLRNAQVGVLKDGTAIGDGLSLAVNRLRNSKAKSKVVILLTDGDNNLGQVAPATAGELAAGYGIKVYTIAIGKEGRVKLPIWQRNIFGKSVKTYQYLDNALNPELLMLIAKTTGAKFYRATDESALASVFKEIDQLEKSDVKATEKVRYDEVFQKPLKLGLLLLLLEQLLSLTWWRFVP